MSPDEITIPTEVLQDIFHLLWNKPIDLNGLAHKSYIYGLPWAVGQVCRHWRAAFLSYTPLWSSFALRPCYISSTANFVEMNRRAALYLERSGQRPLTIIVSMPHSGTQKFPKKVWGTLLSCLKRWKKASFTLGGGAAFVLDGLLRSREYMSGSSLESLSISVPYHGAMKHYNAFQIAPHLTELDLFHPGHTAKWQFPWAQLTKLKLKAPCEEFNNNLWGVLFQLENIEELHIIVTTFCRVRPPSPLPTIRLPCLRFLEIHLICATMFSWFTAPLLERLHIHGCNDDGQFHDNQPYQRELTSLIQRSSCRIRRLSLDECRTKEIRKIMNVLASVEELSIDELKTLFVIKGMTGINGCIYLPKLRVLRVTCNISTNLSPDAVTAFSCLLEARGKGLSLASHDIVPLEKFVLQLFLPRRFCSEVFEPMHGWPSFAQVYVNGLVLERSTPSL